MDDVMLANHIVVARNADDSLNLLAHLDRDTKEFIIPGCDDLRTKKGEKITLKPEWNEYVQPKDLEGYTLHISEGFDIIADNAFEGCNLTGELKIPMSVQKIGKKAFSENDLTSLEFKVPVSKIAENGQSIVRNLNGDQVINSNLRIIDDYAFAYNNNLSGDLYIPEGLNLLGKAAFCSTYKNSASTLSLPSTLEKIGAGAFDCCTGFTGDLVIPDSVTSIGDYAFRDCSGFTGDLVIPNSVISIGTGAFQCCSGLTGDINIPDSVTTIGSGAFEDCFKFNGTLTLSNSLTEIPKRAFSGCLELTGDLVIPDNVTKIGEFAFYNCSGLTGDLVIPDNVTEIGLGAFLNCSGFTGELKLPDRIKEIPDSCFEGCINIVGNLAIPDGVEMIGCYAFYGCNEITGIFLPATLKDLGDNAITCCKKLEFLYRSENTNMHNNTLKGVETHIENAMQDLTQDVIASFESLTDI